MPSTYRDHNHVMEVAISCFYTGENGVIVGDIIGVRNPLGYVGTAEHQEFLWLLLTSVSDLDVLWSLQSPDGDSEDEVERTVVYNKRRFCIPLDRLIQVVPTIDKNRILDRSDSYQPFFGYDEDNRGFFLWSHTPLQIEGLVFDKALGRYL